MKKCPKPGCGKVHDNSDMYCRADGALLKSANELEPGMVVAGEWEILETIAEGGMGTVYRVVQAEFKNQQSALKIMHPRFASDRDLVARFKAEVKITNLLPKEYIVEVYGTGMIEDGRPFLRMEYVPGKSLQALLRPDTSREAQPFSQRRALKITAQICKALSVAHRNNIIHRDIKPANILVLPQSNGEDSVKVLDFGIAKAIEGSPLDDTGLNSNPGFKGTPVYASPEQARGTIGSSLSYQTDIYSLGVVLYEMLTGEVPFSASETNDYLRRHIEETPVSPRERRPDLGISESVSALVMRSLEKDPARRFGSADQMLAEIERILDDSEESASEVQTLVDKAAMIEREGRISEARAVLVRALEADPTDLAVRRELRRIRQAIRDQNPLSLPWSGTVKTVGEWIDALLDNPERAAEAVQYPQLDPWFREILERPELAEKIKTYKLRTASFWGWFEGCFSEQLSAALREKLETLNIQTAALLKEADRYNASKDFEAAERSYRQVLSRDPGNTTAEERIKSVVTRRDEQHAYQKAVSSGLAASLESFLSKYPAGPYASDVKARIYELRVSNLLKQADECCKTRKYKEAFDAYAQVLQKEPGNTIALQGQKRAQAISREEHVWKRTVASGTIEDFEYYLRDFPAPHGYYASEATARLQRLLQADTERALQQADEFCRSRNSADAENGYRAVLQKQPDNQRALEGLERVADIRAEEQLWQRALESGRIPAFENYLRGYPPPGGFYASEAQSRLVVLHQAEIERQLQAGDENCANRNYREAEELYRAVLERDPHNVRANHGFQKAESIRRDEETWRRASESRRLDQLTTYIKAVPNGAHLEEAKELIRTLDQQQEKRRFWEEALHRAEELCRSRKYAEAQREYHALLDSISAQDRVTTGSDVTRRAAAGLYGLLKLIEEENKRQTVRVTQETTKAVISAAGSSEENLTQVSTTARSHYVPQWFIISLCVLAIAVAGYFMLPTNVPEQDPRVVKTRPAATTPDSGVKPVDDEDIKALLNEANDKAANGYYDDAIKLYRSILFKGENADARRGLDNARKGQCAEEFPIAEQAYQNGLYATAIEMAKKLSACTGASKLLLDATQAQKHDPGSK